MKYAKRMPSQPPPHPRARTDETPIEYVPFRAFTEHAREFLIHRREFQLHVNKMERYIHEERRGMGALFALAGATLALVLTLLVIGFLK